MAPSPLDGTAFEGMERMFGKIVIVDDNNNAPITLPQIPDRITCAVALEVRQSLAGKKVFVKEAVKKGWIDPNKQADPQHREF